jgi:hypothetical protein
MAHVTLDRVVWSAYGWDDSDPASVNEDGILSRLLSLNAERRAQSANLSIEWV